MAYKQQKTIYTPEELEALEEARDGAIAYLAQGDPEGIERLRAELAGHGNWRRTPAVWEVLGRPKPKHLDD